MAQKKHTKKPGRPPGSKNRPVEGIIRVPALCPTCGSPDLRSVREVSRELQAIEIHGVWWDGVRWVDHDCAACGQKVRVREPIKLLHENNIGAPDISSSESVDDRSDS